MKTQPISSGPCKQLLGFLLALSIAASQSTLAVGQGFGAVQAVRQRVSGVSGAQGSESPPGEPRPGEMPSIPGPGEQPGYPAASAAKMDLRFVSPTALLVAVIRPAQIVSAPVVQLLPIEVASAASREWLGVELSEIDEIVAFLEFGNPTQPMLGLTYGLTFKFKSQFRAASIPEHIRPAVQLSDLNNKKYLKSAHPLFPSFYGPNNKTLVAAPDVMLRKIVEASTQPKTGVLMEKALQAPAGNDLYLAIDGERARGIVPLLLGLASVKIPDQAKAFLESTTAAELTLNLVSRGPINLVVHCSDEATAQQIEAFLMEQRQMMMTAQPAEAPPGEQPSLGPEPSPTPDSGGKYAQELAQYKERMNQRFQPQRNGASITLLHIEADDPLQQQLFGIVVGAAAAGAGSIKSQAAMKAGPPVPAAPGAPSEGEAVPSPSAAPVEGAGSPPRR